MKKSNIKTPFDYGQYRIEYRTVRDGELRFLKKKITDLQIAFKESSKLRDLGYDDVIVRTNT
jgi:hypothetical protein